jgi:hypothetical protein
MKCLVYDKKKVFIFGLSERNAIMKKIEILVIAAMLLAAGQICFAGEADLAKENAELKARIDKLEKELGEIKKLVDKHGEAVKAKAEPNAPAAKTAEAAKPVVAKKPVLAGLDVELYGRLKLDAAYDSSRIDNGNYAKWVRPDRGNNDKEQFSMTPRETRLGMRIYGPGGGEMKTSGRVEVDFYGAGEENKAGLMMRHAYLNLDWPEDKFSILAGQTSDVISPLYPDTLNYTVGWYAGNIGYRRPQVRLTKIYAVDKDTELKVEGALARTIGRLSTILPEADQTDSGTDAGFPTMQVRVSATFPSWGYKPTTIGVSGHWGKEEYDVSAGGDRKKFDSWSLNLDLLQPVNKHLTLKGELFTGQNLGTYLGGIGQGVNTARLKEIGAEGGWIEASLGPWDKWSFNVGISADNADSDDLVGMSGDKRELNQSIFGNVIYSVDKNTDIGFELSQWHTEYQGEDDGDSVRGQMSLIYKF